MEFALYELDPLFGIYDYDPNRPRPRKVSSKAKNRNRKRNKIARKSRKN